MEAVIEVLLFIGVVYFCPSLAQKIKPILASRAQKRREAKERGSAVRHKDDRLPFDETPTPTDPNINKEDNDE